MANYYVTLEVQEAVERGVAYYRREQTEADARRFEDHYIAALRKIAASPQWAGSSVRGLPATHRKINIGKSHILYYHISRDGDDVLIYHFHGASQETKRLSPRQLIRKATEASRERDS